jgi:hypothetical protein
VAFNTLCWVLGYQTFPATIVLSTGLTLNLDMTENNDQILPHNGDGPADGTGTPAQPAQTQPPPSTFSLLTATVSNLLGRMPEVKPMVPTVDSSRWILVRSLFARFVDETLVFRSVFFL